MTSHDHRVKPSWFTPTRIRSIFIAVHVVVIIGYFILAFLHGSFLFIACLVSFPFLLVYLPPALWLAHKRSPRVYDRAGAEVAYLSLQMGLWFAMIVLGIMYRGPSYCAEWSYLLGRLDQSSAQAAANQSGDAGLGVQISTDATLIHTCDLDILLNVFSCLHFVWMGVWMWGIIRLVRRLPMSRHRAFKCGVSGLLRGDYDEENGSLGDGDKRSDVELGTLSTTQTATLDHNQVERNTTASVPTSAGPPELPPRPGTRTATATAPELDIPPPAYEPQTASDQQRTLPSPTTGSSPFISPTGQLVDFDEFMRAQQYKMEYKLLLERHGMAGSSSGTSPSTAGPGFGSGLPTVSNNAAGPSRRRRGSA